MSIKQDLFTSVTLSIIGMTLLAILGYEIYLVWVLVEFLQKLVLGGF